MPTYEYRREDGTTFEIRQRITEDPLEVCPETGQKVERLIGGGGGIIFKGSGFYETDYVRTGSGSGSVENGSSESETSADSGSEKVTTNSSGDASTDSSGEGK